jgi:hypothetical protein
MAPGRAAGHDEHADAEWREPIRFVVRISDCR